MSYSNKILGVVFLLGLCGCRKVRVKNIDGLWNNTVNEFVYTGPAHRNSYIEYDINGNTTFHNDTDIIISVKYFLAKQVRFKVEDGLIAYSFDAQYSTGGHYHLSSNTSPVKVNKSIILCDTFTFSDEIGYFGIPAETQGSGKLTGKFINKKMFEGQVEINDVYQKIPYDPNYRRGMPMYQYFITANIPVSLIKD